MITKKAPFSDLNKIKFVMMIKSHNFGFENKKNVFLLKIEKSSMELFYNLIKIRLWKFEDGCLKTVRRDIFLMKLSFLFAFSVFTFQKEPIELSDYYFEFVKL